MNKPQSLFNALITGVPYLRDHWDKMHLSVSNGSLVSTGAQSMSWEYRYTLNIAIEGYDDEPHLLMVPVMLWLNDNQPDAINNPTLREKLFTFDINTDDEGVGHVHFNLQLTERVIVEDQIGSSTANVLPEPTRPEEMWTVKR